MSYNSYDITEVIKKYTLICLIKNINKIDDNYLNCFIVLLTIDDNFKNRFLKLLIETQKTN